MTAPALLLVAGAAILLTILLISALKLHPFLALLCGSLTVTLGSGLGPKAAVEAMRSGAGSTLGSVGLVLALGAMLGRLLARSGAAHAIAGQLVRSPSPGRASWAVAAVAAIIGIPLFFEVGLVVLFPVIGAAALAVGGERQSLVRIGLSGLASLSVLHGLIPPHPGPLAASEAIGADVGRTLILGLIAAVPIVVISGPLFARLAARAVSPNGPMPALFTPSTDEQVGRVSAVAAYAVVLLPVALMLGRMLTEIGLPEGQLRDIAWMVGDPAVALLVTLFAAFPLLRVGRNELVSLGEALPAIAGVLLIVGAGGALKQSLIAAGVGDAISSATIGLAISPLLFGWTLAALVRLATGSATVATITAAALVAPLAGSLAGDARSLLVLAIGAGSVIFSHVNDAGFWLVKELFGLTLAETFRTWSMMETLVSVSGLIVILTMAALLTP